MGANAGAAEIVMNRETTGEGGETQDRARELLTLKQQYLFPAGAISIRHGQHICRR